MRKLYVEQLQPGMVLGKTVYNERGDILLAQGVSLSSRYIRALQSHGFYAIYILDGIADDVEPPDVLSDRVRIATYKHVHDLFAVAQTAAASKVGDKRTGMSPTMAASAVPYVSQLYRDVERIIDEVINADTLPGVVSLKTHDNYTFEHSIEVTVAAVMLAKRLYLSQHEMHQLALGCLYHDIGKMMVPPEILNKPGKLTSEEWSVMQRHPEDGYETVRQITGEVDIIARNVVWQHHERQDGQGYPRQLHGNNQFNTHKEEGHRQGRILPAAEIACVADVYSALASDRPYRPAMSPTEVASTMRQMSGKQMNSELVKRFLSMLPSYPVGTEVVAISGSLRGHRGIVTEVTSSNINKPRVRFVFDPAGRRIKPFEVDTSREVVELAMSSYELIGS